VDDDEFLYSYATGLTDTGGTFQLWKSATGLEPWTLHATLPWATTQNWGYKTGLPEEWLRTTETGNGSTYLGQSSPSNRFDNS
jgi:hypothetical protein